MTTIDLGKVAVVPKGEYDAETQYEVLDAVSYQGSSYLAIEDSLGIVPTNPEYWMVLSQKGGSGKRTCRFVVGTSTAGWTEADCDYLCDGVDDHLEIQAAIDALPDASGEIVILDGTYNCSSSISVPNSFRGITLSGNGEATKINLSSDGIIVSSGKVLIKSIYFNCPSTSSSKHIQFVSSGNNRIIDCRFEGGGVCITLSGSSYWFISRCVFNGFDACGIRTTANSQFCNFCNNLFSGSSSGLSAAIEISNKYGNVVCGNAVSGCLQGVWLNSGVSASKTGAVVSNNSIKTMSDGHGILVEGGGGNIISANNIMVPQGSSAHSIKCVSGNNLVVANALWWKNYVDEGAGNTFESNKVIV